MDLIAAGSATARLHSFQLASRPQCGYWANDQSQATTALQTVSSDAQPAMDVSLAVEAGEALALVLGLARYMEAHPRTRGRHMKEADFVVSTYDFRPRRLLHLRAEVGGMAVSTVL